MKKLKYLLFTFILFVVVSANVKVNAALPNPTCTNKCMSATVDVIWLNATNTASGKTYAAYKQYFQDYYKSDAVKACAKTGCVEKDSFQLPMAVEASNWVIADSSEYASLDAAIGTNQSYTNAGTYAYLAKINENGDLMGDKSEYIIYVNVSSDLEIGSVAVLKIKDKNGNVVDEKKDLVFEINRTVDQEIYGVSADFYIKHDVTGTYADLTLGQKYYINVPKDVEAQIINANSDVVQTLTLKADQEYNDVTLVHGQALVIPRGGLNIDDTVKVRDYMGLPEKGYNIQSVDAKEDGAEADSSAVGTPATEEYVIKLGGTGNNFIAYVWDYAEANVPMTGVIVDALPYVLLTAIIGLVFFLVVFSKKKEKEEI